jgi:hypothetical protein
MIGLHFTDFILKGWKHLYVLAERIHPVPDEVAVLDGICGSLREDRSEKPVDRSIVFYGIISRYGALPTKLDYL